MFRASTERWGRGHNRIQCGEQSFVNPQYCSCAPVPLDEPSLFTPARASYIICPRGTIALSGGGGSGSPGLNLLAAAPTCTYPPVVTLTNTGRLPLFVLDEPLLSLTPIKKRLMKGLCTEINVQKIPRSSQHYWCCKQLFLHDYAV